MQKHYPDLAIDGEMQVNFAMNRELRDAKYPFTRLKDKEVNTLVFPNLSSANSAYQLIQAMSETEMIGPIQMGLNKPSTSPTSKAPCATSSTSPPLRSSTRLSTRRSVRSAPSWVRESVDY